jgi:hypothetical protein
MPAQRPPEAKQPFQPFRQPMETVMLVIRGAEFQQL